MVVIVMGVSGAGKSTVVSLLARRLGARFIDGDDRHPPANIEKMRRGLPLDDSDRAPWLSALTSEIRRQRAARADIVVACSALKTRYRETLADGVSDIFFVYLKGDASLIRRRLGARAGHFMPAELLASQIECLEEPRDAIVVDIRDTPERIVDAIHRRLRDAAGRDDRQAHAANIALRCVWNERAVLGEGPVWHPTERRLYFVDIKGKAVHRCDPVGGAREAFALPEEPGCLALRARGGLVVALRSGLAFFDPASGALERIVAPESDLPGNRFNDGACDRRGRFFAATMDDAEARPTGSLYCLSPDLRLRRLLGGFVVPNGIGWSPDDRTLYFTDSVEREILAFSYDPQTGNIADRRVFAVVAADAGFPDGLAVDAQGYVWSAHWDGWCVTRYDPDGIVDRVVRLPVPRPTSCAFGGAALDRLYVTSASVGLSAAQLKAAPQSGGVFELDAGVAGLPAPFFRG